GHYEDEQSTPNGEHPVRIALRSSVIGASPRVILRTTPITNTQVEVITSVQRRRSWSRAEKERIVAAAMEPGAVASEVARAAGIQTQQFFCRRQEACETC